MKYKQKGIATILLMLILIGSSMTAIHVVEKGQTPEPITKPVKK